MGWKGGGNISLPLPGTTEVIRGSKYKRSNSSSFVRDAFIIIIIVKFEYFVAVFFFVY